MDPSLVALLLLGTVLLTIKLEKDRGIIEPHKAKQLENEIEQLEKKAKFDSELHESYRETIKSQEVKIENLKAENDLLKQSMLKTGSGKCEEEYKRGYKEGYSRGREDVEGQLKTRYENGYAVGHRDGYEKGFKEGQFIQSIRDDN